MSVLTKVVTETGCTLRLVDTDGYPDLGDGLLLSLDMEQERDGRHSEVFIDRAAMDQLQRAMLGWLLP